MKTVLLFGAKGMAGHVIAAYLTQVGYNVITVGSPNNNDGCHEFVDVRRFDLVNQIVTKYNPDVVVNCVGMLVEPSNKSPNDAYLVNAAFPLILASICDKQCSKLIHISSDCVFSGTRGCYNELDICDETNVYGRTKALGEIKNSLFHTTIRTSIIGPELKDGTGLMHWILKQTDSVNGYTNAMWNGVTTLCLAKRIDYCITNNVGGLVHLTSFLPVSKNALLQTICHVYGRTTNVIPIELPNRIDKTLVVCRKWCPDVQTIEQQLLELRDWYLTK